MVETKTVNLYCGAPVRINKVTYSGIVTNAILPIDVIRQCLLSHIRVEEVRPDGVIVPLGFDNYDKDTTLEIVDTDFHTNRSIVQNTKSFTIKEYDRFGNAVAPDDKAKSKAPVQQPRPSVDIKEELRASIAKNNSKDTKKK